MTSSDRFFCSKSKDSSFTVMSDKEKQQILIMKKLEEDAFGIFCSKLIVADLVNVHT